MKLLKSTLVGFLAFLFVFFLIYLLGAFGNASLNINEWTEDSRALVASFGGIFSIPAAIAFGVFFLRRKQITT